MVGGLEDPVKKMQLPTASASEIRAWVADHACSAWRQNSARTKLLMARHVGERRINALESFRLAKRWRKFEHREAAI